MFRYIAGILQCSYATRLENPRQYKTAVGPKYLNACRYSTHIADLFSIRDTSRAADLNEAIVGTLTSIQQISLPACGIDLCEMVQLLRSVGETVKVIGYRLSQCGMIIPITCLR
jgi:hypothetical protein